MKNLIISSLAALVILSSCSKHFYAPAVFSNDITYQPKPASFDSAKTANYASIGLMAGTGSNFGDGVYGGELNLSRAHVFNGFNLSYGAFGYLGGLDGGYSSSATGTDALRNGTKSFSGFGGRVSANLFTHNGNTDFRFIGIEAAYSKEFGDYAAFRKTVTGLPNYYSSPHTEVFTIGLSNETIWHQASNNKVQFGVRGFLGATFGGASYLNDNSGDSNAFTYNNLYPLYLSGSFFAQVQQYFGVAEISKGLNVLPNIRIKMGVKF